MIVAAALLLLVSAWDPPGPPPEDGPDFPPPPPREGKPGRPRPRPTWLDSAIMGRSRTAWSGRVELDRPDGRRDTADACGGPAGSRIDFRDGRAMWEAGDSMVLLDPATRTWRSRTRHGHGGPPPGMPAPVAFGRDTLLGRTVMVYSLRGPRGGAQRMWIDTSLPLLLRGEGPGPGARRMLQLEPGRTCPTTAFAIPSGWKRNDPPHRPPPRQEAPDLASLQNAMGFRPPQPSWLPKGFEAAGQGWMEGRHHRMAHLRWSDGSRLISVFATRGRRAFDECDGEGPCRLGGPDPVVVRHLADLSVLVTGPLPPEDLRRIADGLR